jgi:hypothetical protein
MAGHFANGVHAEEVHIVKVTDDSVHAQTGSYTAHIVVAGS